MGKRAVIDLTQTDSESEDVSPRSKRSKKRSRYSLRRASSDNDDVLILGEEEVQQLRKWVPAGDGVSPTAALDDEAELMVAGERGQVRAAQLAYSQHWSLYGDETAQGAAKNAPVNAKKLLLDDEI